MPFGSCVLKVRNFESAQFQNCRVEQFIDDKKIFWYILMEDEIFHKNIDAYSKRSLVMVFNQVGTSSAFSQSSDSAHKDYKVNWLGKLQFVLGWTKKSWLERDLNPQPPDEHAGALLPGPSSSNVGGLPILSIFLFAGASQKPKF